ncbi:type IVB secretion system protein IcmM/DotJ [Legionella micdadei]|uniref:Component of the Dot/Icm secretion system. Predicted inner membrane protein n=1 Tax=Legionella micdadei TaxID=451 RepID=A0A098GH48_LEGMI|nr:type IVB secretion system protein IcmM/DotJ [Legionella micdadei]ARG96823.1 phosphoesterase [Legionella micdadei]ARG99555.1 phosphoesterase [Legionella micdadei]KTD26498.1 Component of the Dot/Icm secretion system, predicted inner membrane protein [Legionella micdadei]NSL17912.1 phosphoesterase [Legionella micdadei]CEG61784.1 Component of the Dot/Icm secretion system. Predicted inner membrane protein [Legionella micdadei]
MSQEVWGTIKRSKSFYIRTYRLGATSLLISLMLNLLLILGIYYLYFHEPERDYYATSGITPPVPLTPLDEPNYSSTPLLPPDPIDDNSEKVIPQ